MEVCIVRLRCKLLGVLHGSARKWNNLAMSRELYSAMHLSKSANSAHAVVYLS